VVGGESRGVGGGAEEEKGGGGKWRPYAIGAGALSTCQYLTPHRGARTDEGARASVIR